ncbi:MAG: histidine ammonia-lyase [Bdellovibrionales bacterium]|nr:histidine ammonia-lyase [Bdellovibrionales bacterium]
MSELTNKKIILDGNSLQLRDVALIAKGAPLAISASARRRVEEARDFVEQAAQRPSPVYSVNTGFGYYANTAIAHHELQDLQRNLILSHASGYGPALDTGTTRLAMALRLNVLLKGVTGVRYLLCEALLKLIEAEIYPIVPEYGSVGASGDLAPLAHLALALIGEGNVFYQGKEMSARSALKKAGVAPFILKEKEGLSLINGTQIMLSIGSLALYDALELLDKAEKITALTFEGFGGLEPALDPLVHSVRGHPGQIESAKRILRELKGSDLFSPKFKKVRVQDPYSLRCAPQVHGASRDALLYAKQVIERELNAATDNPLVFVGKEKIISGGNFHGQPLAIAFDLASIAVSELSNISERRLELLLNPHLSCLPAFLSPKAGLHSGYMAAQYLSASLVNENKLLANPSSTDSIPGNVGIEDHVSMGMTSAKKFRKIVENCSVVLGVELLAASQAVELRSNKKLGSGTRKTLQTLRKYVPSLLHDRVISNDVEQSLFALREL